MKRLLYLFLAVLVAGCAGEPRRAPSAETGTIEGDVSEPRNRARLHTELASLYYSRGNMAVALEELRTATEAEPRYALAHSMFGRVYMELRENKLAQESFERALQLAPDNPDIAHNYGSFLCQTERETQSIKYFLQAIRNPLYQTPWRSYSAAGVCSMRANNLKDAEEFFLRALKIEPDEPAALVQLAQIRYRQSEFGEARRMVARFNRLYAPNPESLWLALRVERKLGERVAEASFATQLRRNFPGSKEYQALQRGEFD
jgi:type IV pilus assembly protein PilF